MEPVHARPVYHRKRESIDAHLSVAFAAPAVSRFIETRTGWSIKKFVRTARRYRTIQIRTIQIRTIQIRTIQIRTGQIRTGQHTITAEDPLPPDLRNALALIK